VAKLELLSKSCVEIFLNCKTGEMQSKTAIARPRRCNESIAARQDHTLSAMPQTQKQRCEKFHVGWAAYLCDCDLTCITIAKRIDSAQTLSANADSWVCLKPQTRLRCCIESAKLCADVGKLGMPQATDKAERLC